MVFAFKDIYLARNPDIGWTLNSILRLFCDKVFVRKKTPKNFVVHFFFLKPLNKTFAWIEHQSMSRLHEWTDVPTSCECTHNWFPRSQNSSECGDDHSKQGRKESGFSPWGRDLGGAVSQTLFPYREKHHNWNLNIHFHSPPQTMFANWERENLSARNSRCRKAIWRKRDVSITSNDEWFILNLCAFLGSVSLIHWYVWISEKLAN